jgi:transcriptional regulator with XRE-family HTH domain
MRFNSDALYVEIDRRRRRRRIRWREVATEAGVSASTLTRLGQGRRPDADGVVRLMIWLGTTDLAPFIDREDAPR